MTLTAVLLCLLCQACLVSGQLFFKKAMNPTRAQTALRMATLLTCGIATQAVWFFLWTSLLSTHDLSRIYPFEGLNSVILAILALVILKERLSLKSWIGLGMICVGIAIVSGT